MKCFNTYVRRRTQRSPIILTIKISTVNFRHVLDWDAEYLKHIIYQKQFNCSHLQKKKAKRKDSHPNPSHSHSHLDTCDRYSLINHTDTVEWDPIWGFRMHVSTLQEHSHTISYMVRKQIQGPRKLLLQAHRPEQRSSVLEWHYQASL